MPRRVARPGWPNDVERRNMFRRELHGRLGWCAWQYVCRRGDVRIALVAAEVKARGIELRVIHVVPSERGTARLPERLWRHLRAMLQVACKDRPKRCRAVHLSVECDRAPQVAHFYLTRLGWEGDTSAQRAARAWADGKRANHEPGDFMMWHTL